MFPVHVPSVFNCPFCVLFLPLLLGQARWVHIVSEQIWGLWLQPCPSYWASSVCCTALWVYCISQLFFFNCLSSLVINKWSFLVFSFSTSSKTCLDCKIFSYICRWKLNKNFTHIDKNSYNFAHTHIQSHTNKRTNSHTLYDNNHPVNISSYVLRKSSKWHQPAL